MVGHGCCCHVRFARDNEVTTPGMPIPISMITEVGLKNCEQLFREKSSSKTVRDNAKDSVYYG